MKIAIKLSHFKEDHVVAVFTDPLEELWADVVMQYGRTEVEKEIYEQEHEPLEFLGEQFNGAERNWTTYEKAAYLIVKVFDKIDHVLWGSNPVHVLPIIRISCVYLHHWVFAQTHPGMYSRRWKGGQSIYPATIS